MKLQSNISQDDLFHRRALEYTEEEGSAPGGHTPRRNRLALAAAVPRSVMSILGWLTRAMPPR